MFRPALQRTPPVLLVLLATCQRFGARKNSSSSRKLGSNTRTVYLIFGILEQLLRPEAVKPLEALLFRGFTLVTWQTVSGNTVTARHASWLHSAKQTWWLWETQPFAQHPHWQST